MSPECTQAVWCAPMYSHEIPRPITGSHFFIGSSGSPMKSFEQRVLVILCTLSVLCFSRAASADSVDEFVDSWKEYVDQIRIMQIDRDVDELVGSFPVENRGVLKFRGRLQTDVLIFDYKLANETGSGWFKWYRGRLLGGYIPKPNAYSQKLNLHDDWISLEFSRLQNEEQVARHFLKLARMQLAVFAQVVPFSANETNGILNRFQSAAKSYATTLAEKVVSEVELPGSLSPELVDRLSQCVDRELPAGRRKIWQNDIQLQKDLVHRTRALSALRRIDLSVALDQKQYQQVRTVLLNGDTSSSRSTAAGSTKRWKVHLTADDNELLDELKTILTPGQIAMWKTPTKPRSATNLRRRPAMVEPIFRTELEAVARLHQESFQRSFGLSDAQSDALAGILKDVGNQLVEEQHLAAREVQWVLYNKSPYQSPFAWLLTLRAGPLLFANENWRSRSFQVLNSKQQDAYAAFNLQRAADFQTAEVQHLALYVQSRLKYQLTGQQLQRLIDLLNRELPWDPRRMLSYKDILMDLYQIDQQAIADIVGESEWARQSFWRNNLKRLFDHLEYKGHLQPTPAAQQFQ